MKLAIALCASLMLASTPCLADPGPLPPGKPAGTRAAQGSDDTTIYILTGVVILGLIVGVAASAGSSTPGTDMIAAP
jgi:uncharacterized membrane-anchored protein YitT (DUF2179 family)